jgi:hypothetical protein
MFKLKGKLRQLKVWWLMRVNCKIWALNFKRHENQMIQINVSKEVVVTCITSRDGATSWNWWGFEFNHKVMILGFRSRHLVLWSLENLMVCESLGKGTSCVRGICITLSKLHCWLIVFIGHVSICWFHLRFKADLSSWECLYLIRLNPNYFKTQI